MKLTTEEKLQCMTASRNALREEIQGLHLVINNMRGELGLKPLFKDLPLNNTVEDKQPKCCKDMKPIKYSEQICPICGRHVPAAT